MAYKISGTKNQTARIVVLKETDWSIEANTIVSGSGAYEIIDLITGNKTVVAETTSGEMLGYGLVSPVFYSDAPSPDPMTWYVEPTASGSDSIRMVATTATDPDGVEYYFDCTAGGGNDSGWQDDTEYVDTGLTAKTSYTYTIKARDKSVGQNETAVSTAAYETTGEEEGVGFWGSCIRYPEFWNIVNTGDPNLDEGSYDGDGQAWNSGAQTPGGEPYYGLYYLVIGANGDWVTGFRPTKVKLTFAGANMDYVQIYDFPPSFGSPTIANVVNYVSGADIALSMSTDMYWVVCARATAFSITDIEFEWNTTRSVGKGTWLNESFDGDLSAWTEVKSGGTTISTDNNVLEIDCAAFSNGRIYKPIGTNIPTPLNYDLTLYLDYISGTSSYNVQFYNKFIDLYLTFNPTELDSGLQSATAGAITLNQQTNHGNTWVFRVRGNLVSVYLNDERILADNAMNLNMNSEGYVTLGSTGLASTITNDFAIFSV